MWLIAVPAALAADQLKPSLGIVGAGTESAKTVSIQIETAYLNQFLRIDSLNATKATDVEIRLSPLVGWSEGSTVPNHGRPVRGT